MYSNKIVNFQESVPILNACTKKAWKLIEGNTYENTVYMSKTFLFQVILFIQTVLIQLIQFSISTDFLTLS